MLALVKKIMTIHTPLTVVLIVVLLWTGGSKKKLWMLISRPLARNILMSRLPIPRKNLVKILPKPSFLDLCLLALLKNVLQDRNARPWMSIRTPIVSPMIRFPKPWVLLVKLLMNGLMIRPT